MNSPWFRFCHRPAWVSALILGVLAAAPAADKDLIELQREVAILTDHVNSLQTALTTWQSTLNEKLGAQGALLQQVLERTNQIQTENALASKTVADRLSQQEQRVATPVAALNAKLDEVISQFSATQESLNDMNSRMGRLEQRIVDIGNTVKVLQAPSAPPPPSQAPGSPPPGTTAEGLFQNAYGDQISGKYDLALQEYGDYLKYFGDTDTASAAQFHIGEILFAQNKMDDAIQAFDTVTREHPKSDKAPDALWMKAQALKKQGTRSSATQVLNQLVRSYPGSDAARRAKADMAIPTRPSRK